MGARPAVGLWGAPGSRCPSVPACDLEQPPRSARCPLCAQDFRGTASRVTCGNFPPMAHRQPQRGEAPSPSRPSPPFSPRWPGRGPATWGGRPQPLLAPWAGPGGWSWGWPAYQPTRELGALLWLLPVRPGRLCGLRSQVRGWHSGTPPHSEIETSAHGDTHGQAHMHSDRQAQAYTETQPSTPRHTRPAHRQTPWRAPKLTSAKSPCPTQRQTQKQKGMGTHRSKQLTNARLRQAERPIQVLPTPHPCPWTPPPPPAPPRRHRLIPFQTFGNTTGGDFNSC